MVHHPLGFGFGFVACARRNTFTLAQFVCFVDCVLPSPQSFQASGRKEQSEENSSNNNSFVCLFVCCLFACVVCGGERRMWVAMARTRAGGVLWAFLVVLLVCLLTSAVHVMGKLDPHYVNNGDLSFLPLSPLAKFCSF